MGINIKTFPKTILIITGICRIMVSIIRYYYTNNITRVIIITINTCLSISWCCYTCFIGCIRSGWSSISVYICYRWCWITWSYICLNIRWTGSSNWLCSIIYNIKVNYIASNRRTTKTVCIWVCSFKTSTLENLSLQ